jgi:hypothetical protein
MKTRLATWTEIVVDNWEKLIKELHSPFLIPSHSKQGNHLRSTFAFRGMADATWELRTSLERLGTPPDLIEQPALRAFGKYAPVGTFTRQTEWERLAIAQHNGLPTRVLDWTVSPLIAAHFATAEKQYRDVDGVIWCVNIDEVRDQILPNKMRRKLLAAQAYLYNLSLLDASFHELSDFDKTDKSSGDVWVFFEPPSIDERIHNQWSILSVMNGPSKSHHAYLQKWSNKIPNLVRRIIIKSQAKSEIRDMLDQNNITERMLFPGLPGLCDWLRRYYGPS